MVKEKFIFYTDDCSLEFGQILEVCSTSFSDINIHKRQLCVFLVENTVLSIGKLLTLIELKVPCVVLPKDTNKEFLLETINCFKPDLIVGFSADPPKGYSQVGEYCLSKAVGDHLNRIDKDIAIIFPTSGSSGSKKFCKLSRNNLAASANQIVASLSISKEDVALTTLSPGYIYGFSIILSHGSVGGGIYVGDFPITSNRFLRRENKVVTNLNFVPTQCISLNRLAYSFNNFTRLRFVTQAGGSLKPSAKLCFAKSVNKRGAIFYSMYGQTEASPRISCNKIFHDYENIDSVGTVVPGGKVYIDPLGDAENESIGEIVYTGLNVFMGYAYGVEDLSAGLGGSPVLRTRDLGKIDHRGYLHVIGRIDRVVKINGYRIELDALEILLSEGSGEIKCLLDINQKLCVFTEGAAEDAKRAVKRHVTFMSPRDVRILTLDSFPVSENNKISYATLKEIANA